VRIIILQQFNQDRQRSKVPLMKRHLLASVIEQAAAWFGRLVF
jgi:hypothetical protein